MNLLGIRIVALVGCCLLSVPVASAATPVKNIVLVHGAWADGSSWAKVIPLLQAKGYNVVSVQNPLSSLADDVAATKRAIDQQSGPVILVGHSWAGMVISEAGKDPKVAGPVYISALVPKNGQSAGNASAGYPASPGLAFAKPDAAGWLWMSRQGVDEDFVPGLSPDEQGVVFSTQGPWNSKALGDTVTEPAWQTKPSWAIVDTQDRMISPQYEAAMAKFIHATTTELHAGHVPMLSMPDAVAAVIMDAANKAAR